MVNGARNLTATAYSPSPLTVAVGTTVTWTNNDVATHDAKADNGGFTTPLISPGSSAAVKLSTAGSFVYHCTIHPGMVGTIVVQ
jgi:plastocyanin